MTFKSTKEKICFTKLQFLFLQDNENTKQSKYQIQGKHRKQFSWSNPSGSQNNRADYSPKQNVDYSQNEAIVISCTKHIFK